MYKVFAGSNYYPSGGYRDFIKSYETEEVALKSITKKNNNWIIEGGENKYSNEYDWFQIVHNDVIIYTNITVKNSDKINSVSF